MSKNGMDTGHESVRFVLVLVGVILLLLGA